MAAQEIHAVVEESQSSDTAAEESQSSDTAVLLGRIPLSDDSNAIPNVQPVWNKYAMNCAFQASLASIMMGLGIGVMTDTMAHLNKDRRITDRQVEYVATGLHTVSLFGSAAAGWTSDRIGRRKTIMSSGIFLFIGTFFMSISTNNFLLLLGRGIAQIGIGFGPMIAAVYIAEVSPASARGRLTSFPEVSINLAIVLGYILSYGISKISQYAVRPLVIILGITLPMELYRRVRIMAESPWWLAIQGRLSDANDILVATSNSNQDADLRLSGIKHALGIPTASSGNNVQVNVEGNRWGDLLRSKYGRRMLICTLVLNLLQQACGIETLLLYVPSLFVKLDITSSNAKLLWTILLQSLKVLPVIIPAYYLDRVGRVRFLLISISGVALSLAAFGTGLLIYEDSDKKPDYASNLCMSWLSLAVFFYSIGMGPIPSVYCSELFPFRLRAQGYAAGVVVNQLVSGVLSIAFLPLYEKITFGGATFIFMAVAIFSVYFVHTYIPETRDMVLEEMGRSFGEVTAPREDELQDPTAGTT